MYKITLEYSYIIIIISDLCYGPGTRQNHCLPARFHESTRSLSLYAKIRSAATIFLEHFRVSLGFLAVLSLSIYIYMLDSSVNRHCGFQSNHKSIEEEAAGTGYSFTFFFIIHFNRDLINGRKLYRIGFE